MERELEKTLMEIEHLIKVHEQRENTHTQSVLEQAREIIELCAQAARTPSDLKKILERDTAKAVQKVDEQPYFRKHFHSYTCPVCHKKVESKWPFCGYCGQKIKREED